MNDPTVALASLRAEVATRTVERDQARDLAQRLDAQLTASENARNVAGEVVERLRAKGAAVEALHSGSHYCTARQGIWLYGPDETCPTRAALAVGDGSPTTRQGLLAAREALIAQGVPEADLLMPDGAPTEPTRCPGCGSARCSWQRLECENPVPATPPSSGAADETLRQAVDGLLRSQEMQTADDVLREAEGMCEERPPCGVCLAIAGNGLDGAHSAWLREQRAAAWAEGAQAMTSAQSHDVYHLMVAAPPNPYRVAARGVPSTDAPTTEPPPCPEHREVQHRDRKPPWCRVCGWNHGRPAIPARKIRDVAAPTTEAGA